MSKTAAHNQFANVLRGLLSVPKEEIEEAEAREREEKKRRKVKGKAKGRPKKSRPST